MYMYVYVHESFDKFNKFLWDINTAIHSIIWRLESFTPQIFPKKNHDKFQLEVTRCPRSVLVWSDLAVVIKIEKKRQKIEKMIDFQIWNRKKSNGAKSGE